MPASPLADRPGGASPAVLARDPVTLVAAELRVDLLHRVAELPAGRGAAGPATVAAALRWRAPLSSGPGGVAESLIEGIWQEAHALAVLAHGALTPIGRALLESTPAAGADDPVAIAAAGLLPAPVDEAVFQTDLTAVVPGLPTPALAELLDAAADRESRGGAATWRFSSGSVRAALDAGRTGEGLRDELRAVAAGGVLPQVLEYLLADVARRHGAVRVRPVRCVLRADDPALLAELAGARALRPLRSTVLAPSVLASARPVEETLEALRAAGYAPVAEDASGTPAVERSARHRAPPPPRRTIPRPASGRSRPAPVDPHALAVALLAAPQADPADELAEVISLLSRGGAGTWVATETPPATKLPPGAVAAAIDLHAPHLSAVEQALLAESIAGGMAVRIGYTNAGGRSSARVIEPIELDRHLLTAWCHLRDEERMFALDRIDAVDPRLTHGSGHVRVRVVGRRHERLLDRARRHPADQVVPRAGLVVGAAGPGAAERLLPDHRAGRLVVDVEVAGREPQRVAPPSRSTRRSVAKIEPVSAYGAARSAWRDRVVERARRRRRARPRIGPKYSVVNTSCAGSVHSTSVGRTK